MDLKAISVGANPPRDVNVVIAAPVGGEPIVYEMDKQAGALVVDRFLHTSMRYPGNYGFIPHTLSLDGDPCDVLVGNSRALVPGSVISCRIVGVLLLEDEKGQDEKLLGVPSSWLTRRYDKVQNYTAFPEFALDQIEHFFRSYKDLEAGKWVKTYGWQDADCARALVTDSILRFKAANAASAPGTRAR